MRWLTGVALLVVTTVSIFSVALSRRSDKTLTVGAYGDTRFTDPSNVTATNPRARMELVERIAEERPDAVILSGDVPWRGGAIADYTTFQAETEAWRTLGLRVIPALGNHEFSQCE